MGDRDNAAGEIQKKIFQPFDRVQVQMVGRLVQQQHVRACHQRLRQCHALLRASR